MLFLYLPNFSENILENVATENPHPSIALANTTFPDSGVKYKWESSASSKASVYSNVN